MYNKQPNSKNTKQHANLQQTLLMSLLGMCEWLFGLIIFLFTVCKSLFYKSFFYIKLIISSLNFHSKNRRFLKRIITVTPLTKLLLALLFSSLLTQTNAKLDSDTFKLSVDTQKHDHIRINQINTVINSSHFIPLEDSKTAINGKSWLKVEWDKRKVSDETYIINDFTSQAFEDYYFIKNNQVIAHYSGGHTDRFDVRPIKHFKFVADVTEADYLLVKTCCNPGVPIYFRLLNKQELTEDYYHDLIRYGLVYGIILFLIIYNGFIYLYLREKQYFYYCYYLLSMLLILLTLSGIGKQFIWPNYKFTEFLYFFASINVSLASISFVSNFLNQQYLTKKNTQLINALIGLHLLVLLSYFSIPYINGMKLISNILVQLVCISAWLVTDYVIIRNIIKGDRNAWVVLISYSLINIAGLVFVLRYNGLMPNIPWTEFIVDTAVLIEGLILSLALAQKIQKLRMEKLAVEKKQFEIQKQFSRQLITFQENERKQISRDLHDNFTHQLLLIRNQLQNHIGSDAIETKQTDKVLNEIRDLSHIIHPYLIDELGIKDALNKMVDNLMEKTELEINFVCDAIKMDEFSSLLLFRIVQEVLTYLINHSNAQECLISLSEKPTSTVQVLIKTDAENLPDKQADCFSMQAIRERVQMLAGTFEITTDEMGTQLELIFKNELNQ